MRLFISKSLASWVIVALLLVPGLFVSSESVPVADWLFVSHAYAEEGAAGDPGNTSISNTNTATNVESESNSSGEQTFTTTETSDQATGTDGSGTTVVNNETTTTDDGINPPSTASVAEGATIGTSGAGGADGESADSGTGAGTETSIDTGDAVATTDVINQQNTTTVGSNGEVVIVNNHGNDGDVVLDEPAENEGCFAEGCEADLNLSGTNNSTTTNTLMSSSTTGSNSIINGDICTINSGNAYAAANAINLVNTNIIGSRYLLFVVNNFGNYGGDVVLPGADFFSYLTESPTGGLNSLDLAISNTNQVLIDNNLNASASSGTNTASADTSTIISGDAVALTNIVNLANTTVIDQNSVYILIKTIGDWTGEIQGLPDGLSWGNTAGGVVIFPSSAGTPLVLDGDSDYSTTIGTANTATITNDLTADAATGANLIDNCNSAVITTGTAAAIANAINVANTTVISRNWVYGLVNILGSWSGNLAFGRPDLWVAQRASFSASPMRGSDTATFTLDVKNFGNAEASSVVLSSGFDRLGLFNVIDNGGGVVSTSDISWNIGTLKPGEGRSVSFTIQTINGLPAGHSLIKSITKVFAAEKDGDQSNNEDHLAFATEGPAGGASLGGSASASAGGNSSGQVAGASTGESFEDPGNGAPVPSLTKTHNAPESGIKPGERVQYEVVLRNDGEGSIYNAKLTDTLYDPYGNVIDSKSWKLGTVYPHKLIKTTYDVDFSAQATGGKYLNRVKLSGKDQYEKAVQFIQASAEVTVDAPFFFPSRVNDHNAPARSFPSVGAALVAVADAATLETSEEASSTPLVLAYPAQVPDTFTGETAVDADDLSLPLLGGLGLVVLVLLGWIAFKLKPGNPIV